jgi:23S rRNA G2445 N2-methylase RlmL
MVEMIAPQSTDEICDPACGTAGFLIAAAEYVRGKHPSVLTDAAQRKHFHASMFHGYDFDATMLRIASMNMLMHGIESPDIRYRDSLSEGVTEDAEKYTLILRHLPRRLKRSRSRTRRSPHCKLRSRRPRPPARRSTTGITRRQRLEICSSTSCSAKPVGL